MALRTWLFLIGLLCLSNGHAEARRAEPQLTVEGAITMGIQLLEQRAYDEFLQTLVAPDDLERFSEPDGHEKFVAQFAAENASRLLAVLKAIRTLEPSIEDDGGQVRFELDPKLAGKDSIVFKKVGKYWYINN